MKYLSATALLLSIAGSANAGALRRRAQAVLPIIDAQNDYYTIIQTEKLEVKQPGILENDSNPYDTQVTSHRELDPFVGKVKVYSDGKIKYEPPKSGDFVGEERFIYEACLLGSNGEVTSECANATVHINVIRDPNKPNEPPRAMDDSYDVVEGGRLEVEASGILTNDESESGKGIFRSQRSTSGMKGKAKTHSDGSFEYDAPNACWTGEDKFRYRAAYIDYPDLESNEAWVTIRVTQSPERPETPEPEDDYYELYEATTLQVKAGRTNGLLWNDIGGELLYVKSVKEHSGFEGELKVDSDGSFSYSSISGKTGEYRFDYEVCQNGWEQCVECSSATTRLNVQIHPEKPTNPATPSHSGFEITQGERLDVPAPGVLDNDIKDSRYTLYVKEYSYAGKADMKLRQDGSLRYQAASDFVGTTESFEYIGCYKEWPDLCYTGTGSVTVKHPLPDSDDSSSRRGVATAYRVEWKAASQNEVKACDDVTPRLWLECGGEGELSLLNIGTNDNANCLVINGNWSCIPSNEGNIYVECRDGRANNSTNRQLSVTMESEPVACQPEHLISTYHVGSMHTLCDEEWNYQGMNCSGWLREDPSLSPLCYGTDISAGPASQPKTVTMTSTGFEECVYV